MPIDYLVRINYRKTLDTPTLITQAQLDARAAVYAQEALETATASSMMQWISFRLGEELFAVHIDRLDEISPVQKGVALPGLHPALMGLMNLRSNTFLLVDTAQLLGMRNGLSKKTDQQRILVIKDEANQFTGLLVDEIISVDTQVQLVFHDYESNNEVQHQYIDSVAKLNDQIISHIDLDKILQAVKQWSAG